MPRQQSATASVSVNNPTPSRASTGAIGVFALITNTSATKTRLTIELTATSNCDPTVYALGQNVVRFNPNQAIQVTVSFPLTASMCLGTYTIHVDVGVLASATTTFVLGA